MVQNGAFVFLQTTLTFQEPPQDFTRPYLGLRHLLCCLPKGSRLEAPCIKSNVTHWSFVICYLSSTTTPLFFLSQLSYLSYLSLIFHTLPSRVREHWARILATRCKIFAYFCRCLLSSNASGNHNPRRAFWDLATLFAAPLSCFSTCDSLTWLSVGVSTNSWLAGDVLIFDVLLAGRWCPSVILTSRCSGASTKQRWFTGSHCEEL